MNKTDSSSWMVLLGLFALLALRSCSAEINGPGPMEPLSSLGLLIVEDSSTRTPEQAAMLTAPEFRSWATAACARLRIVDVAAVQADGQPSALLQPYRDWLSAAASRSGTPGGASSELPAVLLVRSDGSVYQAGPLPDSWAGVKAWAESVSK